MTAVGLMGKQSREAGRFMREILENSGVMEEFTIIDLERETCDAPLDILVAAGGSIYLNPAWIQTCCFFIMNPDQKDILEYAAGSRGVLITYGFNSKVCVTASSVTDNEVQICVQRDLPTLPGGSVEQQEFGVSADTGPGGPENLLAAITAALAAGVEVMVLK